MYLSVADIIVEGRLTHWLKTDIFNYSLMIKVFIDA